MDANKIELQLIDKQTLSMIEKGLIPEQTEQLKLYKRHCELIGLGVRTICTYCSYLKFFGKNVKKPFDKITKNDIENFFISIKERPESSKFLHRIVVKRFFQWFYDMKDGYPEIVDWIKTNKANGKRKLPEELLTTEEIRKLASSCDNLRDRAIMMVLYESGCRARELINLKIKNVVSDNYGILLMVNGKTGMRRIRLINSVNALVMWINNHPQKDNPESYVFVSFKNGKGKGIGRLSPFGLRQTINKVVKRTDIKKRIHPHLFRHSRLTELTKKGYPESFLRHFAGWSRGSNMPDIYVHLSAKNIDEMMLTKEGLKDKGKEIVDDIMLRPIECVKCGETNTATNRFCGKCATPLSKDAQQEIMNTNLIKKIIFEPEVWNLIQAKIKSV